MWYIIGLSSDVFTGTVRDQLRANEQQADRGSIAAHATLLTLGAVLQFIESRRHPRHNVRSGRAGGHVTHARHTDCDLQWFPRGVGTSLTGNDISHSGGSRHQRGSVIGEGSLHLLLRTLGGPHGRRAWCQVFDARLTATRTPRRHYTAVAAHRTNADAGVAGIGRPRYLRPPPSKCDSCRLIIFASSSSPRSAARSP